MTKNVSIETDRLILRTVTMDDIEDVALTWKLNEGVIFHEEAKKHILWMLDNHEKNTLENFIHLCLAIIHKDNSEFIGWCGLDNRKPIETNILFYLLNEEYWGRGLATEAAKAVLKYAFCRLGLAKIDSGALSENVASKRVLEKIGMRYMGQNEEDGGYSFTLTKQEYIQKFGCD